ncbi:MAG TPA: hypothetical protein VFZ70_06905 [Euzebyales bacterium]
MLDPPGVLLLDEPTNNLDAGGRADLYAALVDFPGVLLVVSHDRTLLERVDAIVELRDGATRVFGGAWSVYDQTVAAEQETAAARAVVIGVLRRVTGLRPPDPNFLDEMVHGRTPLRHALGRPASGWSA